MQEKVSVSIRIEIPDTCSECNDPVSHLCEFSKQSSDFWATQGRKKIRRPFWCKYREHPGVGSRAKSRS